MLTNFVAMCVQKLEVPVVFLLHMFFVNLNKCIHSAYISTIKFDSYTKNKILVFTKKSQTNLEKLPAN